MRIRMRIFFAVTPRRRRGRPVRRGGNAAQGYSGLPVQRTACTAGLGDTLRSWLRSWLRNWGARRLAPALILSVLRMSSMVRSVVRNWVALWRTPFRVERSFSRPCHGHQRFILCFVSCKGLSLLLRLAFLAGLPGVFECFFSPVQFGTTNPFGCRV